jgi:type IV pilus assembly protein PilW
MRKLLPVKITRRTLSRGMSLIELLVAAAIGLIASIVIFQVFAVFEGQKRTTTSGGEAQINGTLALFTIERELRQAGYGISDAAFLGCAVQGWNEVTSTAFIMSFTPAIIAEGAAGAPDSITVMYGNGDLLPAPVQVNSNSLSATDNFIKVSNVYGFRPGEVVVLAETGKPCTMAQISAVPPGSGESSRLSLQSGPYLDPYVNTNLPTRYNNPAGGLGTAYTTSGKVFDLGPSPISKVYWVENGQLMVQAMGAPAAALYDGIVQLQAQYGKDTTGDGVVDVFNETPPANATEWGAVLAVRIALVARSGLYEKDVVSPATIKLWEDSAAAPTTTGPVWTLTADERHYRYKVFQTVVPLRNMIWRP